MPRSPEEYLLSAILNTKDIREALAQGVTGDMFHTHQEEWVWLEAFWRRHNKIPGKVAFTNKFPDARIHRTTDLEHFCDEVKQYHVKFELTEVLNRSVEFLTAGDIDKAVRTVSASMVTIVAGLGGVDDADIFTSYSDILAEVQERAKRAEEFGSSGIPTGLLTFDERVGGLIDGEYGIVAARLGEAKSWTLQAMAAKAAAMGFNVQFDALEQTRSQVGMRIHGLLSGSVGKELFRSAALMKGKGFSMQGYQDFLKKLKATIPGKLHVSDASRGRVSALTVASQIERNKPDVVFIDYLTLMQKTGPDWQGIAQLSGDIKQIAASYRLPVVAAAQLNRQDGVGKGEPPDAEALAGSDAIGQDCDWLITQRKKSASVIQQKLAKHRNGPAGFCWWLKFRPGDGIIEEVSANDAAKLMDEDADEADKRSVRD